MYNLKAYIYVRAKTQLTKIGTKNKQRHDKCGKQDFEEILQKLGLISRHERQDN